MKRRSCCGSKSLVGDSQDEMANKRIKRSHPSEPIIQAPTTSFLSINVDCMYSIFDLLPVNDLCSLGRTCAQLKSICGEYVSYKYPTKAIVLNRNLKRTGKFKDEAVNCFQKAIKNMDVFRYADDGDENDFRCNFLLNADDSELLKMIPMYSGDILRHITFNKVIFHKTFGKEMKTVLQDIEAITFLKCSGIRGQKNFFEQILKHCQNLSSLIIHGSNLNNLLNHLLPTLKLPMIKNMEFRSVKATSAFTAKLKEFLSVHPIETFTWHFAYGGPCVIDRTFVKMILENAINLEQLYLSLDRYDNLASICEELKVLCDRKKKFRRLEMKFSTDRSKNILVKNSDRLASLHVLTALHFDFNINYDMFTRIISPLVHLKTLQLHHVPNGFKWHTISFEKLINLEELIIHRLHCLTFLQQFVRYCPKLKKIIIRECAISLAKLNIFSKKSIQLLIKERSKLTGACNTTIYTNNQWNMSESKPYIDPYNHLVQVKDATFRYDFKFKPFIKWVIDYP